MTDARDDPETKAAALYAAYRSGYEDPRPMHYRELAEEFGYEEIPEIDMVADAFDLGCRHAENDVEQFGKDELLEEMASW